MSGQPIAAAAEIAPRDGLAGAVGYGLMAAEPDPLDPSGAWAGPQGYVLEGEPCPEPEAQREIWDFCTGSKAWGPGRPFVHSLPDQRPFVVIGSVQCSALGASDAMLEQYREKARRALQLSLWPQIANELWTGARSIAATGPTVNRHLASPEATVLSDEPVSLVEGIAALEDAFGAASAGDVQLIHVPRKMSAYLDHEGVISTTPGSGRIWTANNSLVVADRGYPGTGPHGEEPTGGVCWIYSTGVLSYRLGQIWVPENDTASSVKAETNDIAVRAMRPAAIAWLCAHLAIPVCYR